MEDENAVVKYSLSSNIYLQIAKYYQFPSAVFLYDEILEN